MKRRLGRSLVLVALAAAVVFWWTLPKKVDPARFAAADGDATRGQAVFWAGGCASCHKAPDSEDSLALPGGRRFASPFGTFVAPNISPDRVHGLGAWSLADFASALLEGTSPNGAHYFPALPYTTYARMTDRDVADLWAFLGTLPPQDRASGPHEVRFPFNIRAALGGWKLLFLRRGWVVSEAPTPELERGRYLVEALGHCGECHTPRNRLGGADLGHWLAGAPNPAGKGRIPDITPASLDWSKDDIAYFLETGFTPDFDSAGGEMAEVVVNMSHLAPEDRAAIAAYIKALPVPR